MKAVNLQLVRVNVSTQEDIIIATLEPSGNTFLQSSRSGKVYRKYNNGYAS